MNYFRCGGGRSTHTATKIDVAKTPLASFASNVSGLYLPEILAYIQATQSGSGDPSPSNPRAISGVSEVSVANASKNLEGGSIFKNDIQEHIPSATLDTVNKTLTYTASATFNTDYAMFGHLTNKFKEETAYTLILALSKSNTNRGANIRIFYTDDTNTVLYIPDETITANTKYTFAFTTNATKTISRIMKANQSGSTTIYYDECGIFEGEITTAEFEPFNENTATTALGGTYYGGYLNLETGVLTVTWEIENMGDYNWSYNNVVFQRSNASKATGERNLISDIYKLDTSSAENMANYSIKGSSLSGNVYIKNNDYNDPSAFKTAMAGHYICYELATPQTYQLTPAQLEQMLGQNNVFCSTGDVAVKFWKID